MLRFGSNWRRELVDTSSMAEDIPSLTLKVLQDIQSSLHDLRSETRQTNARLESIETRFASLEHTTAIGFQRVTERLEHIRDFAGERYRDHEVRITQLEARLEHR